MKVRLSKPERDYLLAKHALPDRFVSFLSKDGQVITVEVTEEEATDVRERMNDCLQLEGFDAKYELTTKGALCEALIDKFYVP